MIWFWLTVPLLLLLGASIARLVKALIDYKKAEDDLDSAISDFIAKSNKATSKWKW